MVSRIRTSNAGTVEIDLNGTKQSPITMTISKIGSEAGRCRVFLTVDEAGEIAARLSNFVDAIKRGT